MKKLFLKLLIGICIVTGCFVFMVQDSDAHPPSSIEADYIKEEGKLYVYMGHVSHEHRRHYIRKTQININGEELAIERNRQQIDPSHYGFAVSLKPEEGDEITIKSYCSEGGKKSTTLLIPEEKDKKNKKAKAQEKKESAVKAKVLAYQTERRGSDIYGSKKSIYDSKKDVFDTQTNPYESRGKIYKSKTQAIGHEADVYGSKKSPYKKNNKGSGY